MGHKFFPLGFAQFAFAVNAPRLFAVLCLSKAMKPLCVSSEPMRVELAANPSKVEQRPASRAPPITDPMLLRIGTALEE